MRSPAPRLPRPSGDPQAEPGQVVGPSGARAPGAGGGGGGGGPRGGKGGNGTAGDSSWGDNAGQGSGNPLALTGETLTLPTSGPSPRVQVLQAREWLCPRGLVRPAGPGILPFPTAGGSLVWRETVGWGGQRAERWGARPGVCRGPRSAGRRPQGREAWPGAGPPTESPSPAGSDARYGSQAAQACLGPVARDDVLGRGGGGGGGPRFLPRGPEEDARGPEIPGHPQTKGGRGRWTRGP